MSAISDNLIHFLARSHKDSPQRQFGVFRSIIETGLRTGEVQIKLPDGSSVFNSIICFTDIPLRECSEHVAVYGKFGIGFRKSYVKNVGGNPARYFLDYVPGQLQGSQSIESRGAAFFHLWRQFVFLQKVNGLLAADPTLELRNKAGEVVFGPSELAELAAAMLFTFAFDKEMGDLGRARDESKEIDLYYKEREWRLVPSRFNEIAGVVQKRDDSGGLYYMFDRNDVNMIVVPNEEVRLQVLEYLLSHRGSADARLRSFGIDPPPVISYDDLNRW